ncbi:MAG TPA: hypothetical protein VFW19_08050 [Allosphingosinicella sp.]|nr:hypothetical protein [Allosphingosinicella sp.]
MGAFLEASAFGAIAAGAGAALVFAFLLSWGLDKAFLRRLVRDRIACIAYGCVLAFLLLMGGTTWLLTATGDYYGRPIIIPPLGIAIAFLIGVALAGAARMAIYSRYEGNLDEAIVFDPDYNDLSLYDHEVNAADDEHGHKNYFVRHWVGNLPLPISYWVNGALLPSLILFLAELAARQVKATWASLQSLAIVALLYLVVSTIVSVWSSVGIWRSAYWHRRRGGSPGWGFAARALVLLGAAGLLYRAGDLALQAREWERLAVGEDSLGAIASMKVSADGRELAVRGTLSEGAADRFERLLAASPNVQNVVLDSRGGRMFEAERMATAVRKRGLDTRVDDMCMSACTSVLLAGRERTASQTAQIGFHQPAFPGLSAAEMRSAIEETRAQYLAAGVDEAFVWRAMATPASDIWVPAPDELVAAHVLTDTEIVVGGTRGGGAHGRHPPIDPALQTQLRMLAARFNATGPVRTDAVTTIDRIDVNGTIVTRYYTLRVPRGYRMSRPKLAVALRRQICSDPGLARMIGEGVTLVESFRDGAGKPIFSDRVTDCSGF